MTLFLPRVSCFRSFASQTKRRVQVTLLKDDPQLGTAGKTLSVRPGFARNYLIPKRVATHTALSQNPQVRQQQLLAVAHRMKTIPLRLPTPVTAPTITAKIQDKYGVMVTGVDLQLQGQDAPQDSSGKPHKVLVNIHGVVDPVPVTVLSTGVRTGAS